MLDYVMNQRIQTRKGNKGYRIAPHNCYRCSGDDKWISIAVATNEEWEGLCRTMARPDLIMDERFALPDDRYKNQEELDRIVAEWTRDKESHELMTRLQTAGVAAAATLSSEGLFKDPHVRDREFSYRWNIPQSAMTGSSPRLGGCLKLRHKSTAMPLFWGT